MSSRNLNLEHKLQSSRDLYVEGRFKCRVWPLMSNVDFNVAMSTKKSRIVIPQQINFDQGYRIGYRSVTCSGLNFDQLQSGLSES